MIGSSGFGHDFQLLFFRKGNAVAGEILGTGLPVVLTGGEREIDGRDAVKPE